MKPFEFFLALTLILAALCTVAHGGTYYSKGEALALAFPDADTIEPGNLFLTEEEMVEVAKASGIKPDSALYTFYVGKKGGAVIGYAAIEAATVRTMPETVMVVLDPNGKVRVTEILAFFEPEEYKPARRWLDQFGSKALSPQLRIGADIQGITGATLSAQAITRQVRKSAAMLKLFRHKEAQ